MEAEVGRKRGIMAASPRWKVYTVSGIYLASFRHTGHAAMFVASLYEQGTTIRDGHKNIVWTDGEDGWASDSYDAVATKVRSRI